VRRRVVVMLIRGIVARVLLYRTTPLSSRTKGFL
jgi:hypothetical protein